MKILTEKASVAQNYELYITLLDMSKAFDNVSREKLLVQLSKVLMQDELHMIKILIEDVCL